MKSVKFPVPTGKFLVPTGNTPKVHHSPGERSKKIHSHFPSVAAAPDEDSLSLKTPRASCPVSELHSVIWNSETPASWRRTSSASFPQTITRNPATERPFRKIRAACGSEHPLNIQVDGVVQLFVAHVSYLASTPNPPPSRASLHSRRGPRGIAF